MTRTSLEERIRHTNATLLCPITIEFLFRENVRIGRGGRGSISIMVKRHINMLIFLISNSSLRIWAASHIFGSDKRTKYNESSNLELRWDSQDSKSRDAVYCDGAYAKKEQRLSTFLSTIFVSVSPSGGPRVPARYSQNDSCKIDVIRIYVP